MVDKQLKHPSRRVALMILGLAAALVYGILVLASGDWLPGTIIVAAALAGLAGQVLAIRAGQSR